MTAVTAAVPTRERPLSGLRVAVTRPEGRAASFTERLRDLGASVVECPTIRIADPEDPGPLRDALDRLAGYDWILFTSVTGVDRVAYVLAEEPGDGREVGPALAHLRVGAIGPATARRLRRHGVDADVVPESYRAEALAESLVRFVTAEEHVEEGAAPLAGLRVLLPRAGGAREVLPERLQEAGAEVDEVVAYVAVPPGPARMAPLREAVETGELDWLTFTASSTVENYVELVGTRTGGARVAAIGPVTAGTARDLGLPVHAVAEQYTIDGLVRAIVEASR